VNLRFFLPTPLLFLGCWFGRLGMMLIGPKNTSHKQNNHKTITNKATKKERKQKEKEKQRKRKGKGKERKRKKKNFSLLSEAKKKEKENKGEGIGRAWLGVLFFFQLSFVLWIRLALLLEISRDSFHGNLIETCFGRNYITSKQIN